ncbi:MAG: hypothetical protein H6Q03_350 [Acidobacteria bacterium]|nr:hypothetical protein [Acidobacteriota bacterium]
MTSDGGLETARAGARSRLPMRAAGLGLALLSIAAYYAAGAQFYDGYWLPQGYGSFHLLTKELAHGALFVLFGLAATAGLVAAGAGSGGGRVARLLRRAGTRRGGLAVACAAALLVLAATWAIGRFVLGHAAVLDDEHVYRFIAQTLRTGSFTAPSPGSDLEFYREQYVVLTEAARYGKYPVGHPILLAAGGALGAEHLVVPALCAALALATFALGRRIFGGAAAAFAVALFALSPQVLLTGATALSQPASALCLVAGLVCLARAEEARRPLPWQLAAAGVLGFGVLVRPLPGALFALVAAAWVALRQRPAGGLAPWRRALAFVAPLAFGAALFLAANRYQTGSALVSGYEASDAPGRGLAGLFVPGSLGLYAMSLGGHLLRQNLWLFGWPLSLAFCAFARRSPRATLLWGMVGAAWVYRVLAPKTGVGATGPLYLFETVPLLCLLSADGLLRLAAAGRLGGSPATSARRALRLVAAATAVGLAMFLPVQLANLHRMAEAQHVLPRLLAARGIHHAVVFHDTVVPPSLELSWAFFPRYNSPRLDDDVLFLRYQGPRRDASANLELWRRRYPDRSAWYFGYAGRTPRLLPLEKYARSGLDLPRRRRAAGADRDPPR